MHTNMDGEQNKSEEINVAGVTCLLAAQMEALIERWGIFSFPNQEPPLTTLWLPQARAAGPKAGRDDKEERGEEGGDQHMAAGKHQLQGQKYD